MDGVLFVVFSTREPKPSGAAVVLTDQHGPSDLQNPERPKGQAAWVEDDLNEGRRHHKRLEDYEKWEARQLRGVRPRRGLRCGKAPKAKCNGPCSA